MVAGSTSPIGCALRNTLKKSTKQVQIGLLVKSFLKEGQWCIRICVVMIYLLNLHHECGLNSLATNETMK